ncbi:unnamed protein product, partial [Closterium sp. NIES-64]
HPDSALYAEAVEGPYSSQWQAAMDAEMASWKSTGTYVDAVPPPGANIVSGMWIFRIEAAAGLSTCLSRRAAQRDYELHSLDFNTAFLQGSLHKEIWLRRPRLASLGLSLLAPSGASDGQSNGLRQAPL